MISLTNDVKDFIENHREPIIIYTAGNPGYWTGWYLNQCEINFIGYLDRDVNKEGIQYCGKPIFSPEKLLSYRGEKLRIIIPSRSYESVMMDLIKYESKANLDIMCLIPKYKFFIGGGVVYNINKMLAYFRRKLIKTEIPTIISNDCSAGQIYEMLGCGFHSPTINTLIEYGDFIRLCENIERYFAMEMKYGGWSKVYNHIDSSMNLYGPVGLIGDIKILFGHDDDFITAANRWEYLARNINRKRFIYVLVDAMGAIPFSIMSRFKELKDEKILFYYRNSYAGLSKNILVSERLISQHDIAIENSFDLLGWINQEYNKGNCKE